MGYESDLRDSLKNMIMEKSGQMPLVCTVDSVSAVNKTCYCIPVNETAELPKVKLMAQSSNGFLIVPKVNSIVVVSFLDGLDCFVSMFSEIEEIQLNGKNYGGLPQIQSEVDRLNIIENKINALLNVFTAWIPIANDGGAALKALLIPPVTSTLTNTTKALLGENTTVNHGNGT